MAERTSDSGSRKERHDWMARLARHRSGLAALSFGESTVIPIPLEAIVLPLMIGHPRRSLTIATAIWVGCILGAALFYFAGRWLADPVVAPALDALGLAGDFADIRERLDSQGLFWSVFIISLLPAPMQLATLGAGTAQGSFPVFLAAIALSRGVRYFGLAVVAQFVGERIAHLDVPKRILIPGMMLTLALAWGLLRLL